MHGALCAACRSLLTPGARFCHRCGLAVGSTTAAPAAAAPTTVSLGTMMATPKQSSSLLPWGVAALAFIAVVAILAGQRFAAGNQSATTDDSTRVPLDAGGATPMRAPDISALSPRERADRLFDRMMRLESEGKRDSVAFFAPMALSAYQALGPLDADLRYDMGRVAQISGNLDVAGAQADTILRENPTHLLGLILAEQVASLRGNSTAEREYTKRLLAAEPTESRKNLDEYARHRGDIDSALTRARR